MRDLDHRDIIKGDFLLVSGDVVANFSIEPALAAHKARRAKDPNSIMTMILREAGLKAHRTASQSKHSVFVLDPTADRCVHYEEVRPRRKRKGRRSSSTGSRGHGMVTADGATTGSRLTIEPDLLNDHEELDVRTDLIDPHIDICTPDVLSLWSDNFDYQSLRTSYLFGVLKDYELNGKKLHTHILTEGYAARVKSIRSYDAVSKDIIEGWTYPMRPDSNLLGQTYRLTFDLAGRYAYGNASASVRINDSAPSIFSSTYHFAPGIHMDCHTHILELTAAAATARIQFLGFNNPGLSNPSTNALLVLIGLLALGWTRSRPAFRPRA